MNSVFLSLEN